MTEAWLRELEERSPADLRQIRKGVGLGKSWLFDGQMDGKSVKLVRICLDILKTMAERMMEHVEEKSWEDIVETNHQMVHAGGYITYS